MQAPAWDRDRIFSRQERVFFSGISRRDSMILCIICMSVLSGAAERKCNGRKLEKTPSQPLLMARCLLLPSQHFPLPPENKAAVIASTHKMQGILSAEISGNFTRTQITLVCRVQHCLEREQQTFPLEASFLFRAVYGRGAVSDCGTNILSAFGLEDRHLIPFSVAETRCPDTTPSTVIF